MLKVVFTRLVYDRLVYEPFYLQMRFGKGDLSGRFRAFPGFTSLTFQCYKVPFPFVFFHKLFYRNILDF